MYDTCIIAKTEDWNGSRHIYDNMPHARSLMISIVIFQHDTTVASLLSVLDIYNDLTPPYASMVIMELHQNTSGNYAVKLFYKNSTVDSDTVLEMAIPSKVVSNNCFIIVVLSALRKIILILNMMCSSVIVCSLMAA